MCESKKRQFIVAHIWRILCIPCLRECQSEEVAHATIGSSCGSLVLRDVVDRAGLEVDAHVALGLAQQVQLDVDECHARLLAAQAFDAEHVLDDGVCGHHSSQNQPADLLAVDLQGYLDLGRAGDGGDTVGPSDMSGHCQLLTLMK